MIRFLPSMAICLPVACAQVISIPDTQSQFDREKTVVWTPLFQASWDKMNVVLGGPATKVEPPNELMARMDAFKFDADATFPEGSWKTWAGPGTPEFLKAVNREAASMTGEARGPFNLGNITKDDLAIFGLLDREVKFTKPFFESKNQPLIFNKGHRVRFFGTRGKASADFAFHCRVLNYDPDQKTHALEVSCKGSDDTLILYMPAEKQDFATACKQVAEWKTNYKQNMGPMGSLKDGRIHKDDDIRIPYLSLDTKAEFKEQLKGDRWHNTPFDPWKIKRAEQKTSFALDEEGAKVRVTTSVGVEPFGPDLSKMKTVPRQFIYDKPFFVFLWREKADWPYLGVWIGDTTAMTSFR